MSNRRPTRRALLLGWSAVAVTACSPKLTAKSEPVPEQPDALPLVSAEDAAPIPGCEAGFCVPNVGPCSPAELGSSYVGCEYYATVTAQGVRARFEFAVAISNQTASPAEVTIVGGDLGLPRKFTVPPDDVHTERLPWVPALKTCMDDYDDEELAGCIAPVEYGTFGPNKGYHIVSTQPVTVYQFSPLDYVKNGHYSVSNDASLLLPTNAWGNTFYVAAWQAFHPFVKYDYPSVFAVTAGSDGTMVTITTRADTTGRRGEPTFVAGVPQTVTLNRGDVLQLLAKSGDLTGSSVVADKPIQVIGAHFCTYVPVEFGACDHLEETIFPVSSLSREYLVTSPRLKNGPRIEMIRVVATEEATDVTLDPPIAGPFTLAKAGDFVEIPRVADSFHVKATKKVLVSQYMVGQETPPKQLEGDPSMSLAVAVEQYRKAYKFHAPTNYQSNFVNITAPVGADIVLDGASVPVMAYTPIGSSGFAVARVPLANDGNGNHTATGLVAFGISVYGYGTYTSYWYPGGLDLKLIE